MKRTILTGLLAVGAACLILGCGKKEADTPKPQEPETEQTDAKDDGEEEPEEKKEEDKKDEPEEDAEKAAEYQVIGTESEGAYKVLLTNHTGEAITGFSVKASTDAGFPENMMPVDMKVDKDETVCLYYTASESDAAESSSGKLLRTTYEFSISNESGREITVSGLIFDDIEEAELCYEDEVGFIKYVSVDSGEEISTKEMALAMKVQ